MVAQKLQSKLQNCFVVNLLWPVVIYKTIAQQTEWKPLHHNGNPLEQ